MIIVIYNCIEYGRLSIIFIMNSIKKKKKHSYLLLELLIAIALLSLFLAPMLRAPFSYLKRQKEEIISLYLRFEGEKLLIGLEEELRTGLIPWSKIVQSQKEKVFIKSSTDFFFPDKTFPKVESTLSLSRATLKKLESGTWIGTVQACLEFSPLNNKNKIIQKTTTVFFISKKKLELPVNPSPFPDVKDSICRGSERK